MPVIAVHFLGAAQIGLRVVVQPLSAGLLRQLQVFRDDVLDALEGGGVVRLDGEHAGKIGVGAGFGGRQQATRIERLDALVIEIGDLPLIAQLGLERSFGRRDVGSRGVLDDGFRGRGFHHARCLHGLARIERQQHEQCQCAGGHWVAQEGAQEGG